MLDRGATGVHRALLLRTWSESITLLTDGPSELDAAEAQRLHAAGIPIDERPGVGLRGSDGTLEPLALTTRPSARLPECSCRSRWTSVLTCRGN